MATVIEEGEGERTPVHADVPQARHLAGPESHHGPDGARWREAAPASRRPGRAPTLSATWWRAARAALAPSAWRTARSVRRPIAWTRSSTATFAQARSRTKAARHGQRLEGLSGARAQIVVDQRDEPRAPALRREAVGEGQAAGDAAEVGPGRIEEHAGLQAPDHVQHAEAAEGVRRHRIAPADRVQLGADRRPDLGALGEIELLRHDADDREGPIASVTFRADDRRVAGEPALPERVAEHEDAPGGGLVLLAAGRCGREGAARAGCRRTKRTRRRRTPSRAGAVPRARGSS